MNKSLVWYASYGSNPCRERFLLYIQGGTLARTDRTYEGCRDKTPPKADRPLTINHELFFAGRSKHWQGGARAFIRSERGVETTLGRMYLITDEQFDQVIRQERGMGTEGPRLCPDLTFMTQHKECFLNPDDPSRPSSTDRRTTYGRILNLGTEDSFPVLTFTAVGPDNEITPRAPSRQYLQAIARGMRETFPHMTTQQICDYYLSKAGVRGLIDPRELLRWLGE